MAALLMGPHDGAATPPHDCLPARLDTRARCGEKPDRYSAAGPSETAGPSPVCRRNRLGSCPVASPQDRAGARHPEAGDTLVVSELSRLGRSMLECMEILALAAQKGLHLHAVKGDWQLDSSMQSTIIAMAFAMAAEIERELISQRTREALRVKKAAGMPLGRPRGPGKSKLDPYRPEIEALLRNGSTQTFIAKRYGTTVGNLHHWLKQRGITRAKV